MKIKLWMIPSLCFFIILNLSKVQGQSVEKTFDYAQHEMETGNYENAIAAFQRVLYFGDKELKDKTYLNLANCYRDNDSPNNAYEFYHIAYNRSDNDSVRTEILFLKSSTLLQLGKPNLSLSELLDHTYPESKYFKIKRDFYFGFNYYLSGKYDLSEKHLNLLSERLCPYAKEEIARLFQKTEKAKRVNPDFARLLSMIVPGLGQAYIGDWKNAFNSFFLNSIIAGLGVIIGIHYGVVDAIISISPWLLRYYTGGFLAVEKLAKQKKSEKLNVIYHELLYLFSDCQKSLK